MYVMWVIFQEPHYVDLWLMFLKLAYGMFYIAIGRNANQQNGFAFDAPNKLNFLRSNNLTNLSFSFMVIHIWMRIWRIIAWQLMMELILHLPYWSFHLKTKMFIHGEFPLGSFILLYGLGGL